MMDWQEPEVLRLSMILNAYSVGIGATIIIWEILLALPFDVAVTARRPASCASVIYFLTRPAMLIVLISAIRVRTSRVPIECMSWGLAIYIPGYFTQACASALLLLRVVALSRHNNWIRVTLFAYYLASIVVLLYDLSQIRVIWNNEIGACVLVSQRPNLVTASTAAFFDFLCLGSLLYLLRSGGRGRELWQFLHKQGLQWFVCIAIAHTCSTATLALNLNDFLDEMGQGSSIVISTVCATRMYSALLRYGISGAELPGNARNASGQISTMPRFMPRVPVQSTRGGASYRLSVTETTIAERSNADRDLAPENEEALGTKRCDA